MDSLAILAFSGISSDEAPEIIKILRQCDLPTEDITTEILQKEITR